MYELPSTSVISAPLPEDTKNGSVPTVEKERTGEETPPGIKVRASWKSRWDLARAISTSATQMLSWSDS